MEEYYTSIHTGNEIDEAITSVRQNSAVWSDKADKIDTVSITVPAAGWSTDGGNPVYPLYYDIPVSGITDEYRADITILQSSFEAAVNCGLCPVTETLNNDKIRIRSAFVPAQELRAVCRIEKVEVKE